MHTSVCNYTVASYGVAIYVHTVITLFLLMWYTCKKFCNNVIVLYTYDCNNTVITVQNVNFCLPAYSM